MARIRTDLVGCVYVGMTPYFAGDTVPDGVVDPVFLESGDGPVVGSVSADEAAYSDETLPDMSGQPDVKDGPPAPEELAELAAFDPSEHGVRAVREYLANNPDDVEWVLELEAAGLARKSLIGE